MAMNGSQVLLFVYDKDYDPAANGNKFPDKYIPVAEQTSLSEELSVNLIEAGSKDSAHQKYLYGKAEGTISLEALVVPNPSADKKGYLVLKHSKQQRKPVFIKRAVYDGATMSHVEYAEALVETISTEYPDDDVATLSVDLVLNGEFSTTEPADVSLAVGSNG